MFDQLLDHIERKVGRYRGIRNLVTIIVAATAVVYLTDLFAPTLGFYLSRYLFFNRELIMRGQIWRLFTFIITPVGGSFVSLLLQLLFLHYAGTMLQTHWGTFRFNVFYFCGMACSVVGGMITGYATSYYVNLSIFLAVAILYPMMQVNVYGIIPIRLKWLALIDLVLLLPGLINGSWGQRAAIIISLLNVLLFFYGKLMQQFKQAKRRYEWKKNWRSGNWR